MYTFFEVVGQIWTQKSDFHTLKDPLSQKRCTRAPINEKSQICVFIKMHIHQSLCISYISFAQQQARSIWSATGKNLMQFLLKNPQDILRIFTIHSARKVTLHQASLARRPSIKRPRTKEFMEIPSLCAFFSMSFFMSSDMTT